MVRVYIAIPTIERRNKLIKIGVVGASGYGGGELLRWLLQHPSVKVEKASSRTYAGKPVHASFPNLAGLFDLRFSDDADPTDFQGCDVVFLARDNGVAMNLVPRFIELGCKVIDLSADFRFRDAAVYEQWYAKHASPELNQTAVYGLPELHREEIIQAAIVGNPGCYTTTSILALAPLFAIRDTRPNSSGAMKPDLIVDPASIIVDGKSGVSGAGRSKFGLDYHFAEANESVSAYKIAGTHRHTPEIEQEISLLAHRDIRISFTPHLIPMTRGILATCYANLAKDMDADTLRARYREFYRDEPFVYVSDGLPATKHTIGSNMCHIGLAMDKRTGRVTVVSATDNLGKGMVGQAIQNMNLMIGMEETAGLKLAGSWP